MSSLQKINATALSLIAALLLFCSAIAQSADLTIVSSSPVNNAIDVARTDVLTAQFSTAVNASSVRADTITLQSAAGVQKVALNVSGAIVTVKPTTPLLPWAIYTLTISSITGTGGEQLTTPVAITFKTRDGVWQGPQTIDQVLSSIVPSPTHVTARNTAGIRFVAWHRAVGTSDDIYAVRIVPGAAIPSPTLIASFSRVSADPTYPYPMDRVAELNVVVSDNGDAFVSWTATISNSSDVLHSSPVFHLWASRFVAAGGSTWGAAQIIDGYAKRSATNAHLVFDHAGNAFALWQQYDCCALHSLQSIVVSRYTSNTGWTKPVYLDSSASFFAGKIDIQVDDAGDAYATWSALADFHYPTPNLMVAHYTFGIGWNTSQVIDTESTTSSTGYQAIAVNPRGEAFLMWADDGGLKYAKADATAHWSKPVLIDSTVKTSPTQMILLNNNQAFAVFVNGIKNYIAANNAWSWTHPLLPNDEQATTDPHIVVDANGNAMVAWGQFAKRYRANTGWAAAVRIDAGTSYEVIFDELFLEPNGTVEIAWWQPSNNGAYDLLTNRFE